jgi:hypothetical protein
MGATIKNVDLDHLLLFSAQIRESTKNNIKENRRALLSK